MREDTTEYSIVDDEGNLTRIIFVHRYCGCMSPGCVDDEIQIFIEKEEYPCRITIPRILTPYFEGLVTGDLRISK